MKIAVVKSSVYQDLWVTDISNNPRDLFKSSMMRCPPIGLAEKYGADFIIVEDTDDYPCGSNKNCFPPFKNFKELSISKGKPYIHEKVDSVAKNPDIIDWSKYNIVMCINTCIPARIIAKYPNILWCYWVGENEEHLVMNKVSCYDLILNQDVMRKGLPDYSIGFPYTYIGPKTIENIVNLGPIIKRGIFMEINNTSERPVRNIPSVFQSMSLETGHPIIRHSEDIIENATNLSKAKYYVKLLGRKIRGNSCLESISADTLILADYNLVTYNDLILPECRITSYSDITLKIKYYDENPEVYKEAIERQRILLNTEYFDGPYYKLIDKFIKKTNP